MTRPRARAAARGSRDRDRHGLAVRALRRTPRDLRARRPLSTTTPRPASSSCGACRSSWRRASAATRERCRPIERRARLQWGGRFRRLPTRHCSRSARRSKTISCSRRSTCVLARARRRAARRRHHRRRRSRAALRSRARRRSPRRSPPARSPRGARRRRRRRPRRDRRARARTRARGGRAGCTPAGAATIRSRRRCCSTRATAPRAARPHARGSRAALEARAPRRARATERCSPADDALAAGAAGAARVLARRACAENFVRAARALRAASQPTRARSARSARGACAGSSLAARPRGRSARARLCARPRATRSTAVGDRDVALDLLHARRARAARGLAVERRVRGLDCTPAFGYARLGRCGRDRLEPDAAKAQSRSVRTRARRGGAALGTLAGALATRRRHRAVVPPRPARNQAHVVRGTERALAALDAFARAFGYLHWNDAAMEARPRRRSTPSRPT